MAELSEVCNTSMYSEGGEAAAAAAAAEGPPCVLFNLDALNADPSSSSSSSFRPPPPPPLQQQKRQRHVRTRDDHEPAEALQPGPIDIQSTLPQVYPTEVSRLFFSRLNFTALQHSIRYRVWVETNGQYVIGPQDATEISAIMRSVYLEFGRNTGFRVADQVRGLNAHVLDYAVPRIVSELRSREHYLYDISHLPVPLELGAATSSKGSRQLEMKPFL